MQNNNNFDKWHGVDRSTIQWNPVIDESKCVGCGMCATTCGRGVYKFDYKRKKAVVANPGHCLVACQTCANLCPMGAISFVQAPVTTREKAQEIVRNTGVIANVATELTNRQEELSTDTNHDKQTT
ncbi:MAG: ferredoxin family protein [Candidatus Gottesmanbacteria bacterium]|nr:ferredoxin family protein [Candidatus Gottesmanbacteria bacterium]